MKPSSYGPFEVTFTANQRRMINRWTERARQQGLGPTFLEHLRAIREAVEESPREWGDPRFHLRVAQITVFHRVYERIHFIYGVHDRLPLVFVQKIRLVMDHPLREDD